MRNSRAPMIRFPFQVFLCGAALLAGAATARADEIHHPTAVFDGLDKITGRIISFDVAIDETVQFGTLQITPRVCLTRPQTEAPLTDGFVEVDEIENAKQAKRVFSGWMFAASPGLHGVEHPVYDVWLKDCKGGKEVVAEPASASGAKPPPPNATPAPVEPPRKPQRTITPQNPVEPHVDAPPEEPPPGDQPATVPDQTRPDQKPAAKPALPPAAPAELGAPVEVGPPPGGSASEGAAAPAPAPKPKKPKRKPQPPQQPLGGDPGPYAPPPQEAPTRREKLEPVSPNDLPGGGFFR
jgi:hypothetical protein